MTQVLRALVFSVWAMVHPGPMPPDAEPVADAIVQAVMLRSKHEPIFTSHAEDLVIMALWAEKESGIDHNPVPISHDAKDLQSCGVWQEACDFVRSHSLRDQARYWLQLLRAGKAICPGSPAAPLSGGCLNGRTLADWRTAFARRLLEETLTPTQTDE